MELNEFLVVLAAVAVGFLALVHSRWTISWISWVTGLAAVISLGIGLAVTVGSLL